ncbi:hypothetical protein AB833_10605 [Chromatiales bacterium (ex Bugula neritina AB1)]|nr:hypothetical protein AB833_10605 [Chromatiales bacterium (ex Bugula neritina AB1)]
MQDTSGQTDGCNAWSPGLNSSIPTSLKPEVTLYRSENAFVQYPEAQEIAGFCGLQPRDLISFRPERLLIHELLVRVSADLSVPDGPNYEDLGINLRDMVAVIYNSHVVAELPSLQAEFERVKSEAGNFISAQLSSCIFARPAAVTELPVSKSSWQILLQRLTGNSRRKEPKAAPEELAEIQALSEWQQQHDALEPCLNKSCFKALIAVVGGIVAHRGRILPDPDLIARLATNQVCNQYGSAELGRKLQPIIETAVQQEGYRYLPVQAKPVIMNVKGASASGKSTIRPKQTQLAEKLGVPWEDFALISPDYWRKYLLDYDSLGEDYKYAAMLTGQELEIIDKKLDLYVAEKATRGEISHLLIDRFRFDSFSVDSGGSSDSKLLSRFGDRIFMFFMVTPPAETVLRAWKRGKSTGRYKAVDDLLFHNVEAFTGMPALFFSWVMSDEKQVHFEFLDNDVPLGELPKTAAYGWNNRLTILDVNLMLDIDRYRKVNVDAVRPEDIFSASDQQTSANAEFLLRCIRKIDDVTFADRDTAKIYARFSHGALVEYDKGYMDNLLAENCLVQVFSRCGFIEKAQGVSEISEQFVSVEEEKHYTLGRWG